MKKCNVIQALPLTNDIALCHKDALIHLVKNQDYSLGITKEALNSYQTLFLVRGWSLGTRVRVIENLTIRNYSIKLCA